MAADITDIPHQSRCARRGPIAITVELTSPYCDLTIMTSLTQHRWGRSLSVNLGRRRIIVPSVIAATCS